MSELKQHMTKVARTIISHLKKNPVSANPLRKELLWYRIEKEIELKRLKRKRKLILCGSAAASVALLLASFLFFNRVPDENILAVAESIKELDPNTFKRKEILLQLGNNKEIMLNENEQVEYTNSGKLAINNTFVEQGEKETEKYNQVVVPMGKRIQLLLSDGTKMWVNSGSRVVYPIIFDKKKREIFVQGEVYLDVIEDKNRSFVVKTDQFDVNVLGTAFNISAYSDNSQSSVVLVRGKVNVTDRTKGVVIMKPNQFTAIKDGKAGIPREVYVEKYICWKENLMIIQDDRMDEVFAKLKRYYGKEFVFTDKVAELQVSGKLDLKENLEDILKSISFSVPITYQENANKIIIDIK